MFKHAVLIVITLLLFSISTNFAQGRHGEIGKFLKSSDANILFGKAVLSVPVSSSELWEAVRNAKDYLLFSIKNNKVITNENRKRLTRNSQDGNEREIMFFFSKSIIDRLLRFAGDNQIFFEQRPNNVNTITIKRNSRSGRISESGVGDLKSGSIMNVTGSSDSDVTLEFANICPPICFE